MHVTYLMQDSGSIYGQERATLDVIAGLREAGHRPHVLLMSETRLKLATNLFQQTLRDRGLSFEVLSVRSRFSFDLVRRVRERLVTSKADVLHSLGYKANLHAGLATRWGRLVPLVSTVHGWLDRPIIRERFYDWLDRRLLRRFGRVIVLSRYYQNALLEAGVARERIAWIPSGLNVAELNTTPPPESGFTVGIMGRLSFEKNHPMFLRAAAILARAGVPACYLIAGDGPDRPGVEGLIRELGLADGVILAGYQSREDFFGQVHVAVLTSRIENLPYTVLEAMAWGRPVVATRVGGLPDLVEDGATGFLVDPDDHEGLARAIRRLAEDPALRSRCAENARAKLEAEFCYDRMIARHVELYRDMQGRAALAGELAAGH